MASCVEHSQWRSQTFIQNNSSKLILSNKFLKAVQIKLTIFLSISFKCLFNIFLLKILKEYSDNNFLKSKISFGKKEKTSEESNKVK